MMKEKKLGDTLQSIRLSKKYSVQEVSFYTRIPERFVTALENNSRKELPSDVQAKGYLRILASYYDEDPTPFLKAWDAHMVLAEESLPDQKDDPLENLPDIPEISDLPASPNETAIVSSHENQTSAQIFSEIGKQLASRRIQLGLDLAEVEGFTHIKEHNLSFLEKGGFDQIPSPVQARGMLKIYAEFLEFDQYNLLQVYAEGLRKKRDEQVVLASQTVKKKPVSFKKNNFLSGILTPDMLVVGSIVLVLFITIIWGSSYISKLKQETDLAKLGIDREIIAVHSATPSPTISPTVLLEPSIAPPSIVNQPNTEDGQVTPNSSLLQLNLTTQQNVWVRITTDNEIAFEGRLTPGNPYNYSANKQIILRTGNAGSLQVLFNNQYIGALGKIGDVAEVVFNESGITTPTPQFSPTPSSTYQASITATITASVATATVTPFIP
jgi:cytoskeleton protein RodZ